MEKYLNLLQSACSFINKASNTNKITFDLYRRANLLLIGVSIRNNGDEILKHEVHFQDIDELNKVEKKAEIEVIERAIEDLLIRGISQVLQVNEAIKNINY